MEGLEEVEFERRDRINDFLPLNILITDPFLVKWQVRGIEILCSR
jgi:hypothetical protein